MLSVAEVWVNEANEANDGWRFSKHDDWCVSSARMQHLEPRCAVWWLRWGGKECVLGRRFEGDHLDLLDIREARRPNGPVSRNARRCKGSCCRCASSENQG